MASICVLSNSNNLVFSFKSIESRNLAVATFPISPLFVRNLCTLIDCKLISFEAFTISFFDITSGANDFKN